MLNFPVPYPEELLYSTVARAGIRQGIVSPKQLLDEVFGSRGVIATLDLPNHLATISRWLPKDHSHEELIYNHTLFPIYAPFVPEDRRQRCMEWMLGRSQGAVHLALGVAASRIKTPRFFRYCPGCLKVQRKRHGEYFWRRDWQIAGIEACPEHGRLIDAHIIRTAMERHRFIAASPVHCPSARQSTGNPASAWISSQVRQLLELPARQSPTFAQWTSYYHNLARQQGLCRGKRQVDQEAMQGRVLQVWPTAWLCRYHLTPNCSAESDWLRTIFRKHRKSFNYLQHIAVHQALLGKDWQIREVIDEACQHPTGAKRPLIHVDTIENQNLDRDQQDWLCLISARPPKQARKASPALYARLYRNHRDWLLKVNHQCAEDRSGQNLHRVDWDKRDRECLKALRQLATFLNANQQGPRRSRAYYLKLLGNSSTVEKNLHRMPLCEAFLSAEVEAVPQYQIRRLRTTYDELRSEFNSPPRWRLLRNARLSEERLTESARVYLDQLVDTEHEVQRRRK